MSSQRRAALASSFPAFRVKQDVVPGALPNTLWFEVPDTGSGDEPRVFDLFCTEYCGTDHSADDRRR